MLKNKEITKIKIIGGTLNWFDVVQQYASEKFGNSCCNADGVTKQTALSNEEKADSFSVQKFVEQLFHTAHV